MSAWELPVTILIDLAGFGVGELQGGPGRVDAQTCAFHQSMPIPNVDDLLDRQIRSQLSAFRPGHPQHPGWRDMGLKRGKGFVKLGLTVHKDVDVGELARQVGGNFKIRWVNRCEGVGRRVDEDGTCAGSPADLVITQCTSLKRRYLSRKLGPLAHTSSSFMPRCTLPSCVLTRLHQKGRRAIIVTHWFSHIVNCRSSTAVSPC